MTLWRILSLALLALGVALAWMYRARLRAAWRRLSTFKDEVMLEMRKVSWPTRDHVIGSTLLVGVAALALMVLIGVIDVVCGRLVEIIFAS